jgi:hypothetical protein
MVHLLRRAALNAARSETQLAEAIAAARATSGRRPALSGGARVWNDPAVLVVHGTKKLRDRMRGVVGPAEGDPAPGLLGRWYATAVLWRPQLAFFAHEATLLPVVTPLAPTATLLQRFPAALVAMLRAHGVPEPVIDRETAALGECRLTSTADRSLVGVLNEFVRLADHHRHARRTDDLVELSLWLAQVPCGPLYDRHVSPDRELAALLTPDA